LNNLAYKQLFQLKKTIISMEESWKIIMKNAQPTTRNIANGGVSGNLKHSTPHNGL
jgi:hypothetical protein